MGRASHLALAAVAWLGTTVPARAPHAKDAEARPPGQPAAPPAAGRPPFAPELVTPASVARPPVRWSEDWPRFRLAEYAATAVLGATSWYVRNHELPPNQPKWVGSNSFDETIRGWLVADTRQGRERAGKISDWTNDGTYAVSFGVDLSVALFVHRQPRLTWQLLMMDVEAFVVAGLINNVLFYEVGRGRPSTHSCAIDPGYDSYCGSNASLPSGHTLTSATAAGVTCVHHRYLPLYGSTAADRGACVVMILATAVTGTARIVADRHNASDVLIGATIGFGSGYGLPWLLHYRPRPRPDATPATPAAPEGLAVAVVPFGGARTLGLGLAGTL